MNNINLSEICKIRICKVRMQLTEISLNKITNVKMKIEIETGARFPMWMSLAGKNE